MLPITHTGAARGCRESSRAQFLCSHPDLVERLSAQKQSRVAEKCEAEAKTNALSSAPGWILVSHLPQSPHEMPHWLLHLSSPRVQQPRLAAPTFPLSFPTEIPPGKRKGKKTTLKKERGTRSRTDQYVAFPVSSTGKTHAVGKSSMSRLVSPREQAVPPAGGCCVIPQGTIQSSLTQGVLPLATQNSTGPSLAEMAGSKEGRRGRRNVGTELGEKENETFTVVLSLVNHDTLSTWPLQKEAFCKICFPAQRRGLHPVITCTCPC